MTQGRVEGDAGSGRLYIRPASDRDRAALAAVLTECGIAFGRSGGRFVLDANSGVLLRELADVRLEWSNDAGLMVTNRRLLAEAWPQVRSDVRQVQDEGVDEARVALADISLEGLDDHQIVNIAAMTLPNAYGFCLFDEQGVGKTVSVIYAFDALVHRNQADVMVVIAPKSMLSEWQRAFGTFMGDLYSVNVVPSGANERQTVFHGGPDVVVLNFEAAQILAAEIKSLARRCRGKALLVVDESYFVKNPDARRTTSVRELREWFGRAWVLCGTPAPNAPHDIVSQFNIADLGFTFSGIEIPDDRDAALPVVREAMAARGVFLRNIKSVVLPDLPRKQFTRVLVDLEPSQAVAYESALDDLIADLREMDDRTFARQLTSVLARRMALLRICSNPTTLVPGYSAVPAKLQALDAVLGDAIAEQGEKVIVWSSFTDSLAAVVDRYPQFNPVRFDGKTSSVERADAIRRFQDDDETMLFVANPAAAGAGLTLHRARLAVYESLSNQAAHFLQSVDRIHRRGQSRAVEYVVLLARDSIEVADYERLMAKEVAARELLGDDWEPSPTRERVLDELLSSRSLLKDG